MKELLWNGFNRVDFLFEGREAILVFPKQPNENKNWLFKTEYFDAFPKCRIFRFGRQLPDAQVENPKVYSYHPLFQTSGWFPSAHS